MTIHEEIEELKISLKETVDEHEQGTILLNILNKCVLINRLDSQIYFDRLLQLGELLNLPLYKAWANYYKSVYKRNKGEYDVSLDLGQQTLSLFKQLMEKKGIADTYNNLGIIYNYRSDFPQSLQNHFASLSLREEIEDKTGIAASLNNIGMVYENQGKYHEALKKYFGALRINEKLGNKSWMGNNHCNIGIAYNKMGNYPQALESYLASLKLAKETENKFLAVDVYINIGIIHFEQKNYSLALQNYDASLKLCIEIGHKRSLAINYNIIGIVYCAQGKYNDALKSAFNALKLSEDLGDKSIKASSHSLIGNVYKDQAVYKKALDNFFASLKCNEDIGNKSGVAKSRINIGIVYFKQGFYKGSLENHLSAFKIATEIGGKEIIKESSFALTNTYKANKDFENALKYHEKYHEIESEILGEQAQKQLTNLNFQHNMEQKEKDLEIEQLRNVELKKERDRSETLLLNILPVEVAEELKNKGKADAKLFDDVTVLFTDFKSFTTVSEKLSPQELVDELNICFSAFDEITGKYNIEKIKTVGDAYLAVSGLPLANSNHAMDVINAATEIRDFIKERRILKGDRTFDIRIGIHSGSVVAGIVGIKKFAYDIWGDTVNIAARMEQNSEAGKINISEATYLLISGQTTGQAMAGSSRPTTFQFDYRGEIEAKNKGKLKMYFVERSLL